MTVNEDVPPPRAMIPDHPAHQPGHKLKRVENDGRVFVCDGCMEPGAGTRYRCEHERCNFKLHTCCAVTPDTFTQPRFGNDRVFLFLLEPPAITARGNKGSRVCVACGKDVRGFVYHCFDDDDGIDLHPCCTRLPEHALWDETVSVLGKEASRQRVMSDDDDKHSGEIRRPPAVRHRRWVGAGRKAGGRDPPPENTHQQEGCFLEHRQEAQRPSDASDDRSRRREHRPPAARHRWWKP